MDEPGILYQTPDKTTSTEVVQENPIPTSASRECHNNKRILLLENVPSAESGVNVKQGEEVKEDETPPKPVKKSVSISKNISEYDGFSGSFDTPNFDELFANSGRYKPKLGEIGRCKVSVDEGISSSIDIEDPEDEVNINFPETDRPGMGSRQESFASKLSRGDSTMDQSFKQILEKSYDSSRGYVGFRRRVANDMNHKYFSFCRCDDVLFVFLQLVFGMVCICAGVYGFMECEGLYIVNYFMFLEGLLSVFVFPISIMNWTKYVGGCAHKDQIMGKGFTFLTVLILRTATVILGTALLVLHTDRLTANDMWCKFVMKTLLIAIIFGWTFIFGIILLPLCWFGVLYLVAKCIF